MRINKYIAQSGYCSRRKADELVEQGRVAVNGRTVKLLGFSIRTKDKVTVDGKLIRIDNHEYYLFYKPTGYITTKSDEKGRKTIYDIIPKELHHLNPVGRLDKDSSGLLILTNDGDLTYDLTHPSIKVAKVYRVVIDALLTEDELDKLASGIEIEKGKIAYCDCEVLDTKKNETTLEITLYQGMNRQIRKMFECLGHNVLHLKRIRHASIMLLGVKKGEVRRIKLKQIKELKIYIEKIKEREGI